MCASSTLSITHCRPLLSTIWFALCRAPPHLTPLCWVSIKTGLHGQQAVHSSSDLFSAFVVCTVSILTNSFHFQQSAFHRDRYPGNMLHLSLQNHTNYCFLSQNFTLPMSIEHKMGSETNLLSTRGELCIQNQNKYHVHLLWLFYSQFKITYMASCIKL